MDLADGSLQWQYENYRKRLEVIKTVGLHKEVAERELTDVLNNLRKDLEFLQSDITCLYNFQLNVWSIDVLPPLIVSIH